VTYFRSHRRLPQKLNATHFAKILLSDLDRFAGVVPNFAVVRDSVHRTFEPYGDVRCSVAIGTESGH
jgi:hypothetical protein